jgi:hypothetical protein
MTEPAAMPMKNRTLMRLMVDVEENTFVEVEHVYAPAGHHGVYEHVGDGPPHDPGLVGLTVKDTDEMAGVLLFPDQALLLANRLIRAANLVMESDEGLPDVEREAARFHGHGEG